MADKQSREGKRSLGTLKVDVDLSDALKGLKAAQREARKATAALKELETTKANQSLLTIELESLNAVPKIYYKGEEVTALSFVDFGWKTKEASHDGSCGFFISHYVTDDKGMPLKTSIREVR